ncbi:MAG: S8 family serine peptidase [Kangiellaceae bacterium]|nr:S8 family serine peptidase [Kangiellaceae bacterium]
MAETTPYGIGLVQANQVSDSNTANRKVCITDTGYAPNHEDLRSYTASNIGGNDNDGNGNDTGNWYNDGHGHGTHVAGTIAAKGGNGVGVVGVNPSDLLGLHIVKVFNDSGNWAYGSDLVAAVNQCVNAGSNVISMSLGGSGSSTTESNAFQNALNNGVLSIAASGNSGSASGNDAFSYPASYDSVVSVGALNSSKQIANFSQKNSQVELSAPGVSVNSTLPNNQYASWNGTSMATPHVSGVAALVWSHYSNCTAVQMRKALNDSAEDLGSSGRDQAYGYGLVQAKAAYDYLAQYGCEGNGGGGGGGDDELTNGQTVSNIGGASGSQTNYFIDVPAGATNLQFNISGGTGDADLYVKFGSAPTTGSYDCRPYRNGNNETCSFASPSTGRYYVMLRGYSAYSGVSLTASFDEDGGGGGGSGSINETNLSASQGNWNYFTIDVPSGMSSLELNISGGSGDADLYVRHGSQVTTSGYDCRPYRWGNTESCSFNNPASGTWYIGVRAYSTYSGVTLSGNWQ